MQNSSASGNDDAVSTAAFAGGCFWCIEAVFEELPGVSAAVSGYMGGTVADPSYEAVCAGNTGHREVVQVTFDPAVITYGTLLDHFWRAIDPTDAGGQFTDRGSHYRTAVYYYSEAQRIEAEASKEALERSGVFDAPVVTDILSAAIFYPAEGYHQGYYKTCPVRYRLYKEGSGREGFLQRVWQKR